MFRVPKPDWDELYECLLPADQDPDPAKWELLGELRIQRGAIKPVQVDLYTTDEPVGAFAIYDESGRKTYYRGGRSARLGAFLETHSLAPLRSPQEVEAIIAVIGDDEARFDVPAEHWQPLFDAMLPAKYDPNPATWVVMGELHIKLKNGEPFYVALFQGGMDGGAFASGRSHETRVYYLGGDSEALAAALEAARASAPQVKVRN